MYIQSYLFPLIFLLESLIVICKSQGDLAANTFPSQSSSSHHFEIDWSEFGNLVEIEKDSEWKNYQKETLTTKGDQQHKQDDNNFQIKSTSKRGIKEAEKRKLLQKNDPEKYERLRKNKLERRKQRRILRNQTITKEEKEKEAENRRRIKERYKARHKERTGFTRPESIRLKAIREREQNKQATPEELVRLEKVRKNARETQRRYKERKKTDGLNPPPLVVSARGLDIDLNEAAIEEVDQPKRPFLPTKKEDAARIALEKKRKRQREYKKRIDNDPIRRAAFLSKQRAQQKEYRKNLSKKQKEHRSEKIRSAYFKRKNGKNQGFSSQIQKERHRIISLEKEKKASPEELAFLAKIRAGDRKRKRKQLERESEKAKKND